jgi:hypothetical protein
MNDTEHRVDDLFDSFFNPAGDKISIYRNKVKTHFKITVTEDLSSRSLELDREQFGRLIAMMRYALGKKS